MHPEAIVLGFVAALVALAFHELGHVAGGLLVGFRFSFFAIGPLLIERTSSGNIRLRLNSTLAFVGGAAAMLPGGSERLCRRFAVVVAGGPVFSLVLAVAAAILASLVPPSASLARTALGWLRLLSGLVFLGTAVPIANGAFASDGRRFLRLVRGGFHADRDLALLSLTSAQLSGVPPREWDAKLLNRGLVVRDGSMFECQMQLFSYQRQIDSGEMDGARLAIERAVALAPKVPRSLAAECYLEAAFFESTHGGSAEAARVLLAQAPARAYGVAESDRLRARGALALAEQDYAKARTILQAALSSCPGWASGPKQWINQLLASVPRRED